jgi:beta-phosphoglucomutase-like phosphatase (HAD superfamily)
MVAAERLGVRFEDCVGIEDARAGVEAIKAARMLAVGVGRDLPGADLVVADTRSITVEALEALFTASSPGPARGAAQ